MPAPNARARRRRTRQYRVDALEILRPTEDGTVGTTFTAYGFTLDASVLTVDATMQPDSGPAVEGDTLLDPDDNGFWVVYFKGLTGGSYTFEAQGFDSTGDPVADPQQVHNITVS
jgi:hypothetical protein